MVKNPVANAGEARDTGSVPGLGRSLGGGHGNPHSRPSGEAHGQRSLVGYSPWSHKELDTTERLSRSWSIVAFQCCVSFYSKATQLNIYIIPSFLDFLPTGHHRVLPRVP